MRMRIRIEKKKKRILAYFSLFKKKEDFLKWFPNKRVSNIYYTTAVLIQSKRQQTSIQYRFLFLKRYMNENEISIRVK